MVRNTVKQKGIVKHIVELQEPVGNGTSEEIAFVEDCESLEEMLFAGRLHQRAEKLDAP